MLLRGWAVRHTLEGLTKEGTMSRRNWQKVADQEFKSMDKDAQAQWQELRERTR